MTEDRTVTTDFSEGDQSEKHVRPQLLDDFVGQSALRENLDVFVKAARDRREAMDHVLFFGPPGLGKTTLAQIVARELGVGFRATSGPVISKAGDLAAILTNLEPFDVLFIDEIHRLNSTVEEILYPAMEDGKLDLIIGEGPSARSVQIELPPFTLVGATTRSGLLTTPLRERFGIPMRLEFYEVKDLEQVVLRAASVWALTSPRTVREKSQLVHAARRVSLFGSYGECAILHALLGCIRCVQRLLMRLLDVWRLTSSVLILWIDVIYLVSQRTTQEE